VSNAQVARHLATRGDGASEVAPSTNFPTSQDYDPAQVVKVVWGTAVEIDEVIRIFRDFLDNFKQKHRIVKENPNVQTITESENRPFYPQLIDQASEIIFFWLATVQQYPYYGGTTDS
jgi:DNA replication licensing factor MCM4